MVQIQSGSETLCRRVDLICAQVKNVYTVKKDRNVVATWSQPRCNQSEMHMTRFLPDLDQPGLVDTDWDESGPIAIVWEISGLIDTGWQPANNRVEMPAGCNHLRKFPTYKVIRINY